MATINAMPPVSASAVVPAHSTPPVANIEVNTPYSTAVTTKNAATNSNSRASICMSVLTYGLRGQFTVVVQEKMLQIAKDPEVVIDITSFQWNWKFGYQRVNFKDGTLTYDGADPERKRAMVSKPEGKDKYGEELVGPVRGLNTEDRTYLNFDKVETLGTSTEIPVLVLPSGKRIEFQMASADVIHAFWVPEFLFKRDVMPNPVANNSVNVFQIEEITKTGAFVGHCAEMCGTYHSMMNFEVRVVTPNDFKAYLQQRIDGKTNAEALRAINQPPLAVAVPFAGTRRCSATEKCCGNWLPQPSAGGQRATLPRKALCSSHIRGHRC